MQQIRAIHKPIWILQSFRVQASKARLMRRQRNYIIMLHRFIVLTAMGSCGSTAKQVTVLNVFQINRRKCYFIILVDISLINDTIDQFLGLLAIWISSMNCLFIFFHHFPVWILVSFYWLDVIKALILCQIYCEYFLLFFHLSFNVYYRGIKT